MDSAGWPDSVRGRIAADPPKFGNLKPESLEEMRVRVMLRPDAVAEILGQRVPLSVGHPRSELCSTVRVEDAVPLVVGDAEQRAALLFGAPAKGLLDTRQADAAEPKPKNTHHTVSSSAILHMTSATQLVPNRREPLNVSSERPLRRPTVIWPMLSVGQARWSFGATSDAAAAGEAQRQGPRSSGAQLPAIWDLAVAPNQEAS